MIKSIKLANFKAFGDEQSVPIKPITLIFGANSSGKSSAIHSLLFAQNAFKHQELDTYGMEISGNSVDLGGFKQFIYKRETSRRMSWSLALDVSTISGRLKELTPDCKNITVTVYIGIHDEKPVISSYQVSVDGDNIFTLSYRSEGYLQMDTLNTTHRLVEYFLESILSNYTFYENLNLKKALNIKEVIDGLVSELRSEVHNLLPKEIIRKQASPSDTPKEWNYADKGRDQDIPEAIRFFLPRILSDFVGAIYQHAGGFFDKIHYLGPLRSYPPRHLIFSKDGDPNWLSGGGYAWDIVRKNPIVRKKVNEWLGSKDKLQTPYVLEVQELFSDILLTNFLPSEVDRTLYDFLRSSFETAVEKNIDLNKFANEVVADALLDENWDLWEWVGSEVDKDLIIMEWIDKLKEKSDDLRELVIRDMRSNTLVSHRDVGIGISQVLPVLDYAHAFKDQVIVIEQPEIHLHPGLQAELGDVFIESALGENRNTFILETHSEHLILRIMRRIRETTSGTLPAGVTGLHAEDVCILFVEPGGTGSIIREMLLNKNGELVKSWPGGFFEEGLREVLA